MIAEPAALRGKQEVGGSNLNLPNIFYVICDLWQGYRCQQSIVLLLS